VSVLGVTGLIVVGAVIAPVAIFAAFACLVMLYRPAQAERQASVKQPSVERQVAPGGITAKTLWTRYVTLKTMNDKINPEVKLYVDQREHPIYNWSVGTQGFSTPAQVRANYFQVKAALVTACLSGDVDIFQYGTGIRLTVGNNLYWADVFWGVAHFFVTHFVPI